MVRWACACAVFAVSAAYAIGQEPLPDPLPQVIYESPYLAPQVVSGDVLIEEARRKSPLTPEGWIISNRPIRSPDEAFTQGGVSPSTYKYLHQLRRYDSQIRLAKAEIESLKRRLRHYSYFNEGTALFATMEKLGLMLHYADERLKELRFERTAFLQQHLFRKQFPFLTEIEQPLIPSGPTLPAL